MAKSVNKEKLKDLLTLSRSQQILLGVFLILLSIIVFSSILSYFNTWRADQSGLEFFSKKFGALISHFLIYKMFGVGSFVFTFLLFITGLSFFVGADSSKLTNKWIWGLIITIWTSLFFGYFFTEKILAGTIGFEMTQFLSIYTGDIGVVSILIFGLISFIVIRLKVTPEIIFELINKYIFNKKDKMVENDDDNIIQDQEKNEKSKIVHENPIETSISINKDLKPTIENFSSMSTNLDSKKELNENIKKQRRRDIR